MANEITLPSLGEGVKGGDVLSVLVKAGDTVEKDQPVIELETDKATVEVPASVAGTIAEVKVAEGDQITVGQVLFTLAEGGGAAAGQGAAASEDAGDDSDGGKKDEAEARGAAEAVNDQDEGLSEGEAGAGDTAGDAPSEGGEGAGQSGRVEVPLPSLGEGVNSADVLSVLVKVGDTVARDQGLLELETDKATVEVPAPSAGTVAEVRVKDGDSIAPGDVIVVLEGGGAPAATGKRAGAAPARAAAAKADKAAPAAQAPASKKQQPPAAEARAAQVAAGAGSGALAPPRPNVPAAPSVRRLARELGLDIADVKGSGPGGRISQADVMAHAKSVITRTAAAPTGGGLVSEPLPDFSQFGEVERKAMRGIRRKTAERMLVSWHTVPHVTQCEKADITDLEALRKQYGKRVEEGGGKLTVTAIAIKVAAIALRRFPHFNVSVDLANEEIVEKRYVNIGLAVDTDRGLLVPVIRDADTKSLTEIAAEVGVLADKARKGKLSLEEMSGGCFTITNLGGIGGTYFTPIVNHPEVAILGMSRSAMEPVWRDGEFEPRLMLPLSLSYDHRVIDGADAMRFLRFVADALEQPFVLSL